MNMQMKNKFGSRMGFTLIELLVVVLIIGILTAVAVPQYQNAIAKARFTQLLTASDAIRDAEKVYYFNNGVFTQKVKMLTVSLPKSTNGTYFAGKNDVWTCAINYSYTGVADANIDTLTGSRTSCKMKKPNIAYQQWYLSGKRRCCAYAEDGFKGEPFCKRLINKQTTDINNSNMRCWTRS